MHIPHPAIPAAEFAEGEGAAASVAAAWMKNEKSEDVWEQTAPRVHRSLDEIFAGEYEGYR